MSDVSIALSLKQSIAWHHLHDLSVSEVFFGGGAGSGKSLLGCVWQINQRIKYAKTHGFIGRNRLRDAKDSTLQKFFEAAERLGYKSGEDFRYNENSNIANFRNGSKIFFRDLFYYPSDPDFTSLGSTEYTDAFIDEAPDVTAKAYEILSTRIRYKCDEYGITPKLLSTGNPGDHFIRYKFVYDKNDNPINLQPHQRVVLATLLDNPDKGFIRSYIRQLENLTDDYDKRRLLYGDWLVRPRTGREYWPKFSLQHHVRQNKYDPNRALHISYDFNANPYMTLLVAQIIPNAHGNEVNFLKEYCLEHPENTTTAASQRFRFDMESGAFKSHNAGLFYYGDHSGKNASMMGIENINHQFDVVESVLRRYLNNNSDRVVNNPAHVKSREFMNRVFAGKMPFSVFVDREMRNTIKDMLNLKQAPDGGMLKEVGVDNITGKNFEKYGHCSQALYYLCIGAFINLYDEFEFKIT